MADAAGTRFVSLLSLMARLRAEGGCPWDREQTRASLRPYVIEEAYEVVQAIDEGSRDHLVEELGDLLFQVVFHSQLGAEAGEFTMDDVVAQVCDKMTRRHPHVFGKCKALTADQVLDNWERIKLAEKSKRELKPASCLVVEDAPTVIRRVKADGEAAHTVSTALPPARRARLPWLQ